MDFVDDLMIYGANRRSERTLIELRLDFGEAESDYLEASATGLRDAVVERLQRRGVRAAADGPLSALPSATGGDSYGALLCGIALALQQHTGHRVDEWHAVEDEIEGRCCFAFEYEHNEVGDDAKEMAILLLGELAPEIELPQSFHEHEYSFDQRFDQFMATAPGRVLPLDTQAIIDAARRLDVPWAKLEREPYTEADNPLRVRPQGLLRLGHAGRQQIVDGTFCPYRNDALAPLIHDRTAVLKRLAALGLPLARRDRQAPVAATSRRALRSAERIGYPVVVKAAAVPRGAEEGPWLELADAEAVRAAATGALRNSRGVLVEAQLPGDTYKLLVANGELLAVLALEAGAAVAEVSHRAHPSLGEAALKVARELQPALMTLTVVSTDIGQPLGEAGAVVNLDVAPELDALLPAELPPDLEALRAQAAEGLVRALYPEGEASRIPLVAVTGTNGKTTVCNMIAKILQATGRHSGRAGTTGFYVDEKLVEFDDLSGGRGHHLALGHPDVDIAVLECARGGISGMGVQFDRADVTVLTNVTDDHLGERGVYSLEDMVAVKEFIVQCASEAVVLNADDPMSAAMLPRLAGRKAWMVSQRLSADELRDRHGPDIACAVVEGEAREIVLHDGGQAQTVIAAADIPATFDGTVTYNVSNALQAIAAAYQAGAPIAAIHEVLGNFRPDQETNPGRLNFYHGHPFTVLMDYAHNAVGYGHLFDFLKRQEVSGRTLFLFQLSNRETPEQMMQRAGLFAGHADLYICRRFRNTGGYEPEELTAIARRGLLRAGVPDEAIIEASGEDSLELALRLCRPGDLLVVFASAYTHFDEWKQIVEFDYDADS